MPSEDNVQILKESKARFEGVIFNQTADLGTNKSTSCKVIDEATGEVIAQSGGGGGGESDYAVTTATVTFTGLSDLDGDVGLVPPILDYDNDCEYFFADLLTNGERDIILVDNKYEGDIYPSVNYAIASVTVTGNITVEKLTENAESWYHIVITGDGTITVSRDK